MGAGRGRNRSRAGAGGVLIYEHLEASQGIWPVVASAVWKRTRGRRFICCTNRPINGAPGEPSQA